MFILNINVLCLGAKIISPVYALKMIDVFLETDFLGSYHIKRINKLHNPKLLNKEEVS